MLNHVPTARRRARRRKDAGYVMALFALILLPLTAFAGIGIDIASWYARAAALQRGADAAALAGAAQMPNFTVAKQVALTTAKKNGFQDGVGDVSITVTEINEYRISVSITDSKVMQFFSKPFKSNVTLTRSATAEYQQPIPLGSPTNYFGNDPVGGSPSTPVESVGLWGNIHGPKTDNYKGDRYAAGCRGNSSCGSMTNPEYRPDGYIYTLDVPPGAGNVTLQVYDAGLYPRSNEQIETGDTAYNGSTSTTTVWQMWASNSSALDDSLSIPMYSSSCNGLSGGFTVGQNASASTYENKWVSICQVASTSSTVRYRLQVKTTGNGDGANRYALRARYTGSVNPTLSAYKDMSMFNNQLTTNPNFYLAKVDGTNQGKSLLVYLYDPGEIGVPNAKMKLMNPQTGAPATSCTVRVYNNPTDASPVSSSTYSGSSGCAIPTTDSSGNGLYNGKLLSIVVPISSTYTCNAAQTNPGCWWKILYDLHGSNSGSPQDTTTWSAAILGDPVHLVNTS